MRFEREEINNSPMGPNIEGMQGMEGGIDPNIMQDINELIISQAGNGFEDIKAPFDPNEFYQNLVPIIKESNGSQYLTSLGHSIITKIEADILSMQPWEDTTLKGMKLLGLEINEIPNDSRNVPPLTDSTFLETMNSLEVHIVDEILKQDGCVNTAPRNVKAPMEIYDGADYLKQKMNEYLTEEDKGFYADIRRGVKWYLLTGNLFRKVYIDEADGLPKSRFISKLIYNDQGTSIEEASRITEKITLSRNQVIARIKSGFFFKEEILPATDSDLDEIDAEILKQAGKEPTGLPLDSYDFYICACYLPLIVSNDGYEDYENRYIQGNLDREEFPYRLWIDKTTNLVMRIERFWDPRIAQIKFREQYYHWIFLSGFGLTGTGLATLLGNNANILNFGLKQILDSALKANHPGFLMSAGLRNKESTLTIQPSTVTPLEMGGAIGDLKNSIFEVPTKEPSAMLYQLINDTRNSIRSVGASIDKVGEFNPNIPVGTIIALIGQYMKIPNHIVRNIYNEFSNELAQLGKLMFESQMLDISYQMFVEIRITSIADPHLTSDIQRSLQGDFLMGLFEKFSQFFNPQETFRYVLAGAKIAEPDKYLNFPPPPPEPVPLDPVNENINASNGLPIMAVLEQDHPSHIVVHSNEISIEMNKPQPDFMKINKLMLHNLEHDYLDAVKTASESLGELLPHDPMQLSQAIPYQNLIAQFEAQKIIENQQANQQPQIDPTAIMLEDIKMKEEVARIKQESDMAKLQSDKEIAELKAEVELMKAQIAYKTAQEKNQTDLSKLIQTDNTQREKIKVENSLKLRQHEDNLNNRSFDRGIDDILKKYNL